MPSATYRGMWWRPSDPTQAIGGTLTFDEEEGGNLELIGDFRDSNTFGVSEDTLLICGVTDNGKRVTALECRDSQRRISIPGLHTATMRTDLVVVGQHIESADLALFADVSIRYSALEEWIRNSGISQTITAEKDKPPKRYTAAFEFPEEYEVAIEGLTVSFPVTFRQLSTPRGELHWRAERSIRVKPDVPTRIETIVNGPMTCIRNLLAFATRTPVRPLSVHGRIPTTSDEERWPPLLVHMHGISGVRRGKDRPRVRDILLRFEDIQDDWGPMLQRWIQRSDDLAPLFDAYFAALFSDAIYAENRFLMFARALEVYHRRVHGGAYLPPEHFDKLLGELVDVVKGRIASDLTSAGQAFRTKLSLLNHFSLRTRLKRLLDDLGDMVDVAIVDRKLFANQVVDLRNYLTHYDEGRPDLAPNAKELYLLTEQLKVTLELLLLRELGLPDDRIAELARKHDPYSQLRRHLLR